MTILFGIILGILVVGGGITTFVWERAIRRGDFKQHEADIVDNQTQRVVSEKEIKMYIATIPVYRKRITTTDVVIGSPLDQASSSSSSSVSNQRGVSPLSPIERLLELQEVLEEEPISLSQQIDVLRAS